MSYESHFSSYPNLKAIFFPDADRLEHGHPLLTLVQRQDPSCKQVASHTDLCTARVLRVNKPWIEQKVSEILKNKDNSQASATLGEIRAYGELLDIFREEEISSQSSGSDF